jgi:hypothetical protein
VRSPVGGRVRGSGTELNGSGPMRADESSLTVGCPKLCGGRLRLVDSSRWGPYWRCGRCGHECRDSGRDANQPALAAEPRTT